MRRRTAVGSSPARHCQMALCSLSTGRISPPPRSAACREQVAGHDHRFLVGQRDRLAGVERGAAPAARPSLPTIAATTMSTSGGVAISHRLTTRGRAPTRLAQARQVSRQQIMAGRNSATCSARSSTLLAGGEADDLEAVGVGADDVERLAADRPGRAEDGDASRVSDPLHLNVSLDVRSCYRKCGL